MGGRQRWAELKIAGVYGVRLAKEDGPLDRVAQFPHIAGERVSLQRRLCFGGKSDYGLAQFTGIALEKVTGQR